MKKQLQQNIEATLMCVLIAMLRISSIESEKKSNEDILRRANDKMKITCGVRKRKTEFLCHVTGKKKLEHPVTTGNI